VVETVGDGDREFIADVGSDQRRGDARAVREGARQSATQVDGFRLAVNDAVTVRPVCGRAASAAAMAGSRLVVAGLAERPQPASANPPATVAATNARRLR
jgi:hypothetical protein